jgi:hypothetical protein
MQVATTRKTASMSFMLYTVLAQFSDDPKVSLKYCYENELKDRGLVACIIGNGE